MKEKIQRFFMGRYGSDILNRDLYILGIVLLVLSFFVRHWIVIGLFYICFIVYVIRALSKNIVARSIENQKYVHARTAFVHRIKAKQKDISDSNNRHFVCPKCAQIIRVPKGKGDIEITCPNCRNHFEKKS